ncbi:hypothetical protein BB561_006913 [Smittium simulii]|uniref:Uncharacterized protein n=1 Tax=Smittium simulii TaxID=133385 RepID=A0A2T9Y008_9FUNG|nr:hypothetical protein BB561_006913 [Smittium simulii]
MKTCSLIGLLVITLTAVPAAVASPHGLGQNPLVELSKDLRNVGNVGVDLTSIQRDEPSGFVDGYITENINQKIDYDNGIPVTPGDSKIIEIADKNAKNNGGSSESSYKDRMYLFLSKINEFSDIINSDNEMPTENLELILDGIFRKNTKQRDTTNYDMDDFGTHGDMPTSSNNNCANDLICNINSGQSSSKKSTPFDENSLTIKLNKILSIINKKTENEYNKYQTSQKNKNKRLGYYNNKPSTNPEINDADILNLSKNSRYGSDTTPGINDAENPNLSKNSPSSSNKASSTSTSTKTSSTSTSTKTSSSSTSTNTSSVSSDDLDDIPNILNIDQKEKEDV